MARSRRRDQVWRFARAGLADMPGNAAWVLSRALKSATATAGDTSAAPAALVQNVSDTASAAVQSAYDARSSMSRRTARASRRAKGSLRTIAEGIPGVGDDSVPALMRRADEAFEHAKQQEARAVSLAQAAKQAADEAAAAARESDRAVEQAKRDAEKRIEVRVKRARAAGDKRVAASIREQEERVREARQDSDEFVEVERRAEAADAIKATKQVEAEASRRVRAREQEAERAQARAAEAIAAADGAMNLARGLADRASEAAQQAAKQANMEADRLSGLANDRAREARLRSAEADHLRQKADDAAGSAGSTPRAHAAASSQRANQDARQYLDVLHRNELQRLASDLKIDGHATMTKPDLIRAIDRKRGLNLDALTKDELLRIGRNKGSGVRASMKKDQLVAIVGTSETPTRSTQASARKDK